MQPRSFMLALAMSGSLISVAGVALSAEKSMVRSETKAAMEFQASGSMKLQTEEQQGGSLCRDDYPIGKDACHCKEGHTSINTEEMCIVAAKEAGATVTPHSFAIPYDDFHKHPKGCFKMACKHDPKGICYYYNAIGDVPSKCGGTKQPDGSVPEMTGLPVCFRPRYQNGTLDNNGGCPAGYDVITQEAACSAAGICLGRCEGSIFRKAMHNESQHDEFPQGCFIDKTDGCVYYNRPLANWDKPKRPIGTPICNVTTITDFRTAGAKVAAVPAKPA